MTHSAHAPPGVPTQPRLTLVPEPPAATLPRPPPILEIARCLRGRSIRRAWHIYQGTKTLFLFELSDGSVIVLLRDFASRPYFKSWSALSGPLERALTEAWREFRPA